MTDPGATRQSLWVELAARPETASAEETEREGAPTGKLDLREVFAQELGYVLRVLRRLGVEAVDVEDAAHDTFLQVHRHLAEFDARRPLRPWLFGFAFRTAAHRRRKASTRREVLHSVESRAAETDNALERLLEHEHLTLANEALQRVEVSRRAVLLAHEVEGFTMPEIAETLGIPLNTAYSRLRLARREFARALERAQLRRGER